MAEFNSFLGKGWGFPPSFSNAGRNVRIVADEEDIKESLTILLCTAIGERMLQPEYGCNLFRYVFEPANSGFQAALKDIVFDAIFYFEPRVEPLNVTVEVTDVEGKVIIDVEYEVRTTNARHNLVFPFYLNEGTNVDI
jgi:phage baseplate assembly protein W